MRKLLLFIVLIALIGGVVAWQMLETSGYVLIAVGNYTVEMSLWALLFLLLLVWFLLRTGGYFFRLLVEPGRQLVRQRVTSRQSRFRARTAKGLLQFIEGRWDLARRNLKRAARHSDMPLINYLAAANAAHELGDRLDANRLLLKAEQTDPGGELAIGLVQARMHLHSEQYEEALAILQRLYAGEPDHPLVLRLLQQAYSGLEDWASLEKLLPDFKRYRVFDERTLGQIEVDIYAALLAGMAAPAQHSGSAILVKLWQDIPRHVRSKPLILDTYINSLYQLGDYARVEDLLQKTLKSRWDEKLVKLFGVVDGGDPRRQLLLAERWLRERPNDAVLMLTLGRLCLRNQLWGKARDYLESSLSLKADPETYAELAGLMARLGEHEKSARYYQQGLSFTTGIGQPLRT